MYFSRPRASISLGGLMRKIHGLPRLVMVAALEVSTIIGTPYSSSFGIAASVIELPQAPTITGTLSRTISFSAAVAASFGSDLLSSISSCDLAAQDAALGIDPVPPDLGAHPDVVPGRGHRARQGLDDADLHGFLGGRRRRERDDDGQRDEKGSDCLLHGPTSCDPCLVRFVRHAAEILESRTYPTFHVSCQMKDLIDNARSRPKNTAPCHPRDPPHPALPSRPCCTRASASACTGRFAT